MICSNILPLFLLIILPRHDDFYEKASDRSVSRRGDFLCVSQLCYKVPIDFPDCEFRLRKADLVFVSRVYERVQKDKLLVSVNVYLHPSLPFKRPCDLNIVLELDISDLFF